MKHGAGIYKIASTLGCVPEEIVDFSSNINTFYSTQEATLPHAEIVRYGDSDYTSLKEAITYRYEIKSEQMALYNGASSAIFELIRLLKPKDVALYAPLYGEYEQACKVAKKRVFKINRFKNFDKKPPKNSIVVFVNPSTPDGKHYDLQKLFGMWKERGCSVIVDESFLEFENLQSIRKEINSYKKLYIIQSFSKFYACAGVRIGAVFSHKKNIKKLHRPLWNLSSFDAEFLRVRLLDDAFVEASRVFHQERKEELLRVLKQSGLFSKIYESDTNFFLVKAKKPKKLFKHLLSHKILVRKCGSFDFLSDKYLRFAVKDQAAIERLEKVIRS
jgi:threonine-phosphate decarboxylase